MQLGDLSVVRQEHQLANPRMVGHPAGAVVVSGQSGVYCEATATWGSSTCGSRSAWAGCDSISNAAITAPTAAAAARA
jgi:hypothetical protein